MSMATDRLSPSLTPSDYNSSTLRDQGTFTSDIELVSLASAVHDPNSEQPWETNATIPGTNRRSSAQTTGPEGTSLHDDAFPTPIFPDSQALHRDEPTMIRRLLLDSWLCEAVAMSFSIGCLAAIVIVVGAHNGKRIPQFILGLTLNTIISVLSTASKASLMFVLSNILGQVKWCWMEQSGRRIFDIQALDNASRGPLGAFDILVTWTGGGLAVSASWTTLFTLAFSPFIQQLVDYPQRPTIQPDLVASVPRTTIYTFQEDDMELYNLMQAGSSSDQRKFDIEPTCPTGRCTWPDFRSVGWCSKCEERTSSTTISNCNLHTILQNETGLEQSCLLDLGNGNSQSLADLISYSDMKSAVGDTSMYPDLDASWLRFATEIIWLTQHESRERSNYSTDERPGVIDHTFLGVSNPLMIFGHAALQPARNFSKSEDTHFDLLHVSSASKCILSPCEQSLTLARFDGKNTWHEGSISFGHLAFEPKPDAALSDSDFLSSDFHKACWQAEPGDLVSMDPNLMDRDKREFCNLKMIVDQCQVSIPGRKEWYFEVNPISRRIKSDDIGSTRATSDTVGMENNRNLSQRLEGIANSLTNYGLKATNDTVRGDALAEEAYVHVRWRWIILPALLELASLTLLIVTIIYSRRKHIPLWKSSLLALTYHGVDDLPGQGTLAVERLSGMELTAKATEVQLVKNEEGLNGLSKTLSRRTGYCVVDEDN